MPNTAVKPVYAESTGGEALWEDRESLIKLKKEYRYIGTLFFILTT